MYTLMYRYIIFLFCFRSSLSHHSTSSPNKSDIIQAFLLCKLLTENVLLKHLGRCLLRTRTVPFSCDIFPLDDFSSPKWNILWVASLRKEDNRICGENVIVWVALSNYSTYIEKQILNTLVFEINFFTTHHEKRYDVTRLKLIYSTVGANKICIINQLGNFLWFCHQHWTTYCYIQISLLFKLF